MRYLLVLLFSLVLAMADPRLAGANTDAPQHGKTLTVAAHRDISSMNPMVKASSHDKWIRRLMFEPLLEVDESGTIHPYLAESWDISSDGRAYTFRLRKGVKFHDGRGMTADDVKFSVDYVLNPKNAAFGPSRLDQVEVVEAVDKHTLKVTLKKPTLGFLSSLTTIQTLAVVPKGSLEVGSVRPLRFPPGTGPFMFADWRPSHRFVIARHREYWRYTPFLERVVFRPITDATVRLTALRTGNVDLAVGIPGEWVPQIAAGKLKGLSTIEISNSSLYRIQFNAAHPPFNNKKLRQAVAHAIDKRELIQNVFYGQGTPIVQKYPEGHPWYFEDLSSRRYDPTIALALLRESGYRGEMIELISGRSSLNQNLSATVQAQLRRVGIPVKLRLIDSWSYRRRVRRGNFSIQIGAAGKYVDPADTYSLELACEPDLKKRVHNATGYCDPEMQLLLDQAEGEMDPNARREVFKQILTKFTEDAPSVYIAFISRFFACNDTVKGFTSIDDGTLEYLNGGLSRTWLDR
jgi:peptide/nickel transport system substrate-binding protein